MQERLASSLAVSRYSRLAAPPRLRLARRRIASLMRSMPPKRRLTRVLSRWWYSAAQGIQGAHRAGGIDGQLRPEGCGIIKAAIKVPMKTIANNAGVEGSVVVEKVLGNDDDNWGYNAATGEYVTWFLVASSTRSRLSGPPSPTPRLYLRS